MDLGGVQNRVKQSEYPKLKLFVNSRIVQVKLSFTAIGL